jgi:hypothetical protein
LLLRASPAVRPGGLSEGRERRSDAVGDTLGSGTRAVIAGGSAGTVVVVVVVVVVVGTDVVAVVIRRISGVTGWPATVEGPCAVDVVVRDGPVDSADVPASAGVGVAVPAPAASVVRLWTDEVLLFGFLDLWRRVEAATKSLPDVPADPGLLQALRCPQSFVSGVAPTPPCRVMKDRKPVAPNSTAPMVKTDTHSAATMPNMTRIDRAWRTCRVGLATWSPSLR